MDPAIFQFYLHQTPAEYAPTGRPIPPYEELLAALERLHGRQRARDMGFTFLAQEILAYLLDTRVLPMADGAWRIDPNSSPLFPRIIDAQGQEIITVSSSRPADEVTAIARLLAAAPDLLCACQTALDEHEQPGAHTWAPDQVAYCDVCDGLRFAFALATTGRAEEPACYDATAAAADARLHKAAPDLLAACRAARARLQATSYDGADMTGDVVFDQLTAAISQATGAEVQS